MNDKYQQWLLKINEFSVDYPNWRYGQIIFNSLAEIDLEFANSIRGTDQDPFHWKNKEGDKCFDSFFDLVYNYYVKV